MKWLFGFLAVTVFVFGQEIPEIPDPWFVPMTFLEQERAIVLQRLKDFNLKGNETVLHLGCRDGSLSNEIAKYLPEGCLVGLENIYAEEPRISSNNVSFLQGKFVGQGWQNCYDFIICTQFDEWDDNPHELFSAIRDALKPGGRVIILTCTSMALPEANPLKAWLRKNQEFAASLQFWKNISFSQHRSIVRKYPDVKVWDSGLYRMIPCFRDLDQFRDESRKWFRKIALLPRSLQEVPLQHLVAVTKKRGMLNVEGKYFYIFRYGMEIACCKKAE